MVQKSSFEDLVVKNGDDGVAFVDELRFSRNRQPLESVGVAVTFRRLEFNGVVEPHEKDGPAL